MARHQPPRFLRYLSPRFLWRRIGDAYQVNDLWKAAKWSGFLGTLLSGVTGAAASVAAFLSEYPPFVIAAFSLIAFAVLALVIGVLIDLWLRRQATAPGLTEPEQAPPPPSPPRSTSANAAQLAIEFNHQAHVTRQPNGSVTVRMSVRNFGLVPVLGLVVRIRSLVPESSARKLSPYTSQFNDVPLKIVRPETAVSINPGDGVEIMVASINPATPEWLQFHTQERDYQTPRGKIWMTLVASAENAQPDQQVFLLTATKANLTVSQLIDPP